MTGRYTPHDVTILVPMLGRPHHVAPLLASVDATSPDAQVLFLVTPGDTAEPVCRKSGRPVLQVAWRRFGDYARKMQAGYEATSTPLLFLGASDLEFRPGWFEAAVARLAPGIGVVGTNDGGNPRVLRGEHSTHSLVVRDYVDRYGILQPGPDGRPVDQPGVILCDQYWHEFVDDDLVGTAKFRGSYAHAADSHVIHKHPSWRGDIPTDVNYLAQRRRMRHSLPVFRARRRLWT